jgi:hypothetical protein
VPPLPLGDLAARAASGGGAAGGRPAPTLPPLPETDEDAQGSGKRESARDGGGPAGGGAGAEEEEDDGGEDARLRFLLWLLNGVQLVKHGRRGWPHKRLFWLDVSGELVGELSQVTQGQATEVLRRSGRASNADRYVSLHFRARTLDFEFASPGEAATFYTGMRTLAAESGKLGGRLVALVQSGAFVPPGVAPPDGEGEGEGEGEVGGGAAPASARSPGGSARR